MGSRRLGWRGAILAESCVIMDNLYLYSCLVIFMASAVSPAPLLTATQTDITSLNAKLSLPTKEQTEQVLSRQKRFFLGNVSFGKIGLVGARLQIFPHAPLGANNIVAFNLNLEVPRALAFLIPGQ